MAWEEPEMDSGHSEIWFRDRPAEHWFVRNRLGFSAPLAVVDGELMACSLAWLAAYLRPIQVTVAYSGDM